MRKMLAQELRDEDNDKQVSRTNGALFVANQCNKVCATSFGRLLLMMSCLPLLVLGRSSLFCIQYAHTHDMSLVLSPMMHVYHFVTLLIV